MSGRHTRGGLNAHSQRDATWQARRTRDLSGGAAQNLRVIAAESPLIETPCWCSGLRHQHEPPTCPAEPREEW